MKGSYFCHVQLLLLKIVSGPKDIEQKSGGTKTSQEICTCRTMFTIWSSAVLLTSTSRQNRRLLEAWEINTCMCYGHGSILSFEPKHQCSIVPNQAHLSLSVDQDTCTFLDVVSAMDICCNNRPRSMYQYSNMAPRLSGHTSIFGVVFFVSKALLGKIGRAHV